MSEDLTLPSVSRVSHTGGLDAMVEQSHIAAAREHLKTLNKIPGLWQNRASLERLDVPQMPTKMLTRFVAKIRPAQLDYKSPCWLWTAGTHDKGYGRFYLGRDPETDQKIWAYAHRIAFEHWIGFAPPGYIIDHQCNHKLCCNPSHLWPETSNDNLRLADERRPWQRRNQYSKE